MSTVLDMDTSDGEWYIKDGVNTFNKTWKEHEGGFRVYDGDKLWYRLQAPHYFTETSHWELSFNMITTPGPISTTSLLA